MQVGLGAFGKHPGWNDHLDDPGLDTRRMAELKRTLYVDGIAQCVESGRWGGGEAQAPGQVVEGFAHAFVHRAGGEAAGVPEVIIGRLWSSRDGKGRDRYPMVVCAHTVGWGLPEALGHVLPALGSLEAACRGTSDAGAVVAALQDHRQRLRELAVGSGSPRTGDRAPVRDLAEHPDLAPHPEGLHRVLGRFEHELAPFLIPVNPASRSRDPSVGSRHLRLPPCGAGPEEVFTRWFGFVDTQIDRAWPVMLILSLEHPWVDLIVGEPTGPQMACLRLGEGAIPTVTRVPYTVGPGVAERAERLMAGGGGGGPRAEASPTPRPDDHAAIMGERSGGSGLKTVLLVAALLLALAVAAAVLLGAGQVSQPSPLPPPDAPASEPGSELPVQSEAIKAAWHDQLALLRTQGPGPCDSESLAHAARIETFLVRLDRSIPREIRRQGTAPAWLGPVNNELALARERRLGRAFLAWQTQPVDPAIRGATDDLEREARAITELYAAAAAFTDDLAAAETLLENGYGLDERPIPAVAPAGAPPPPSIREMVAPWRAGVAGERRVSAAAEPVFARVDALVGVEATTDAQVLLGVINEAGAARPALALAAWRRLGGRPGILWPATLTELDAEFDAGRRVQRAAGGIPDPARRDLVVDAVRAGQAHRLTRFVSLAADPNHVDAGFARLVEFGVRAEDLDPWLRYNHLLHGLRTSVTSADPARPVPEAQVRDRIRGFIERTRALPGGVGYRAEPAATITALERALAGHEPSVGLPWWAALGPAATSAYVASIDGEALVFTPRRGGGPALRFVLVRPDPSSSVAPFYIGDSEVSVAAAAGVHAARADDPLNPPAPLGRMLQFFRRFDDPRFGPRAWTWAYADGAEGDEPVRRATIVAARDWLAHTEGLPFEEYAPGTVPEQPSAASPLQHVSPRAAVGLAALAGCRLPTPAEWRAAVAAHGAGAAPDLCNLRDQTWDRHRTHTERLAASLRQVQAPDAGSFDAALPAGGANRTAARPNDDGALWFVPTTQGGGDRVHHLIGNVAEYVMDTPEPVEGLPPSDPRSPEARAWFGHHADKFGVIGGSALSDPTIDPATLRPMNLAEAGEGYSDVGFRLVFSGPHLGPDADTLAARVDRLLTPTPYLRTK